MSAVDWPFWKWGIASFSDGGSILAKSGAYIPTESFDFDESVFPTNMAHCVMAQLIIFHWAKHTFDGARHPRFPQPARHIPSDHWGWVWLRWVKWGFSLPNQTWGMGLTGWRKALLWILLSREPLFFSAYEEAAWDSLGCFSKWGKCFGGLRTPQASSTPARMAGEGKQLGLLVRFCHRDNRSLPQYHGRCYYHPLLHRWFSFHVMQKRVSTSKTFIVAQKRCWTMSVSTLRDHPALPFAWVITLIITT